MSYVKLSEIEIKFPGSKMFLVDSEKWGMPVFYLDGDKEKYVEENSFKSWLEFRKRNSVIVSSNSLNYKYKKETNL